jgi:LysR family glycine cleavage system transcriptional activator
MDWRSLPPLSALRAFAAFGQTGSFQRAGTALNVSHAAIGQQIRALEDRLGIALVIRAGRSMGLTPAGEALVHELDTAFRAMSRAVDEATGADATRPLQVTMTPSFAVSWLMPRISAFRHEHPEIEMMLNPTPDLIPLEPGGVDVALRFGQSDWPGLRVEPLLTTSIAVVAARSLIGDRTITEPQDILQFPWLQELGTNEISEWLERQGVVAPRPANVIHLPGYLVLEGLRAGEGVTATARAFVERDVAAGRLVVLFEDLRTGCAYHIVTRPGVMRPPLKAFVGWLRRQAAAEPPAATPALTRL